MSGCAVALNIQHSWILCVRVWIDEANIYTRAVAMFISLDRRCRQMRRQYNSGLRCWPNSQTPPTNQKMTPKNPACAPIIPLQRIGEACIFLSQTNQGQRDGHCLAAHICPLLKTTNSVIPSWSRRSRMRSRQCCLQLFWCGTGWIWCRRKKRLHSRLTLLHPRTVNKTCLHDANGSSIVFCRFNRSKMASGWRFSRVATRPIFRSTNCGTASREYSRSSWEILNCHPFGIDCFGDPKGRAPFLTCICATLLTRNVASGHENHLLRRSICSSITGIGRW